MPLSAPRRVGASINIDTGSKGSRREIPPRRSLSRTETSRPTINTTFAAGRALNGRSDPRETFLDDITPIDSVNRGGNEREGGGGRRDSHDLSLSPRQVTRDSLVDNMLMSFDQFAYGNERDVYGRKLTHDEAQLYASFAGPDSYQPTQHLASRNGHGAGHTYSFSSDFDSADDLSRHPGGSLSRERRSMSISNFQSNLGRGNSLRKDGTASFSGSRAPPPQQVPHRVLHTRSGKGSKGNSATSVELGYAQGTGNQRWVHGQAGRSSSFDYGSDRAAMNVTSHAGPRQIEAVAPSFNQYDYDAAPTPTIPVGPRRMMPPSAAMGPVTDSVQPEPPQKLERRRSTKSSKSGYKGRLGANNPARFDHGLIDCSRELPPMPAFIKESATAPAPLGGGGRSKEQSTTRAQPKERPGFFRRVFGSRSSPAVPTASPPSHGSTTSAETTDRPRGRPQHIGTQIKVQHTQSPPEVPPSPPPREQAHVLSKRPSSFFRRRKKSIREAEPPVPTVPHFASQITEREPSRVAPSPVSSLRTVMNPYLKTPARTPVEIAPHAAIDRQMSDSPEPNDRTVRGFSPDYDPDRSATIRAVRPVERYSTDNSSVPPPTQPTPASTSQTGMSRQGSSRDVGHANFLPNSSDNDPGTDSTPNSVHGPEKKWFAEHTILPPSVSKQIALVADYERAYVRRSPSATKPEMGRASPTNDSPRSPTSSNSSIEPTSTRAEAPAKDEEWVMLTPEKLGSQQDVQENRVYLEASSSSEEDGTEPASGLNSTPEELRSSIVSGSTETAYKSATSLPILQIEGREESASPSQKSGLLSDADCCKPFDSESTVTDETLPSEGDRDNARKIYDGNEDFILKERAAAWLGEDNPIHLRTLVAYMELYNFTNLNILAALRLMCGKLVLKAESQQVDRILINFSKRWCQCNPNHGFKGIDIVHTICYSILLLNTDLHLADIDQKMTRSQFIKNTMPTVRRSVADLPPDTFDPSRPSILPGKGSTFESIKSDDSCPASTEKHSVEVERPSWRASFKPAPRMDSDGTVPTPLDYDTPVDDCGPLVKAPFNGTLRTWEVQVEIVLKDFYNSIRSERLPLFGATTDRSLLQAPSSNSLSLFTNGVLRRSPSVLSKAPSEAQSYVRGRTAETLRVGNGKWSSKNRSRPRLYSGSGINSSRTSLDDQSSTWSPSVSTSTWSKYSLGKTPTSMSVDSIGSGFVQGDYQQSIGFANALSQAIIREETIGSAGSTGSERGEYDEPRVAPLLEDESLELHGAPWAKEGIVKHKHHLEALDKKAKDRNWNEVFAVIEKGYMSLFSFSSKSKSKGKAAGGVVGGGNWQENAKSLGSFLLRQTIASALPSPGYSKARPHVWALSLPTGAVHLFQVGTPDIVKEFVSTANYWSARLSNHPLVGGICNIEYGWSDAVVNNSLVHAINESTRPSTRHSMQSSRSLRSSVDHPYGTSFKARLPGDKITISDWTPPTQSMRASNLMEADQLRTLSDYVAGIEEELQKHNELRSPMLLAFTPRHPNSQKAMANWERKSSYLLREIVKFTTYIDCLQAAEAGKQAIYSERAERLVPEGNDDDSDDDANNTLRPE
ncbi:Sec7 domain containing protein [Drepanopeziza brunnea f. sp. 'multigermtubi' MB_m1]|uniref:Sec7 domain containing protein n=2 Tax=Drepanopeziza brunnea f. sp. 'multigermtubi' TaxID=698441 RepID=K1XH73_MARBU|nr:Sec7 domain containing protein [Drepanopeziza brunnea f. sp. 'multigermtubi' MB_m1]EKD11814.1 Sec7 domain containing protein [Drepanopeziza brunnea f. sp. 'multigermtubi' MB_m1]